TRWTPMVIRSTSITERRTARLPWLGPAFGLCLSGSMPMVVANAASVPRTYETVPGCFPVYVWMPPPAPQPPVHDQTPDIQGLLRLRTGIRLSKPAGIDKSQFLASHSHGTECSSCRLKSSYLIRS